ncbi:MAG: peptide deformylase [Caulobacteraceae bacterium]
MALRNIRRLNDEILRKKCKTVEKVDDRVRELLKDMAETMYHADGLGLAAPQVGILKRIVVIDVGEGIINLINPEIIETQGSQIVEEGCLSIPRKWGKIERPEKVTVKALNENGEEIRLTGEKKLASALCHEIEHLDGILYIDKAIECFE